MKKYNSLILATLSFFFLTGLSRKKELFSFNYKDEELSNVILTIAAKKNINVILPMRADEKIQEKFTWYLDRQVTLDEAWDLLQTILTIAGYSVVPYPDHFEIVKTTKDTTREPMELFVGVPPEQLPATDQRIRYLYYLSNIKLETTDEKDNEIIGILKAILPQDRSLYKLDVQSNALLLMGSSLEIKSVMNIINQLDKPGFHEQMDVIHLRYADSQTISSLFNKQILAVGNSNRYRLDAKKASDATYFSKHIKIIALPRTNSVVVLGRAQAIDRVRSFIQNYIDVKPDSGKSILHVYSLQYLQANEFAQVLKQVIESKSDEGTGQSEGERKTGGPQRFFEDVIISSDDPGDKQQDQMVQGEGDDKMKLPPPSYYGGNNLIIAARSDDWKRLKQLIEQLDQPQPQVLIEVLIADLTLEDTRALGSMFRNPAKIPFANNFNLQAGHLNPGGTNPGIIPDSFDDPQTIGAVPSGPVADVARLWKFENGVPVDASSGDENATSVVKQLNSPTPGSTVLTLNDNDGKTWGIAQLLKVLDHNKILSHPHVISRDNQVAEIENTEIRRLAGQAKASGSGAVTRKFEDQEASLKVKIRPRISIGDPSIGREGTVGLQILIDINEFQQQSVNTRTIRNVTTSATLRSGDMLAIGGLIRTNDADEVTETPILSKIPIIGWLFKRKGKLKRRTNLTVFIMPTIIESRLRGGIGDYTTDYLRITKHYAGGNLFESLKDPITRWFFGAGRTLTDTFADNFVEQDEVHTQYGKNPLEQPKKIKNKRKKTKTKKNKEFDQDDLDLDEVYTVQMQKHSDELKKLVQDVENPFDKVEVAKGP